MNGDKEELAKKIDGQLLGISARLTVHSVYPGQDSEPALTGPVSLSWSYKMKYVETHN